MIRHVCPHQQVLGSLVELDIAADHVVRGCWNSLGHSNPNHCQWGVQIAFLKGIDWIF